MGVKSKNKQCIHEAIKYYSKGIIEVELHDNPELRSILYSNRAQAEIHLRENISIHLRAVCKKVNN